MLQDSVLSKWSKESTVHVALIIIYCVKFASQMCITLPKIKSYIRIKKLLVKSKNR